ncbi:MAG: guanine deaminase [SAR324 cluster bacterium]|nr:guanine deaminase [SAR324 cluster bacterium]
MNPDPDKLQVFKGSILFFTDDPDGSDPQQAFTYYEEGLLIVEGGYVKIVGPAAELAKTLPREFEITDYSGKLIIPGFVDTHIHYPQTDIIASYGKQLLEWLDKCAFPIEGRFSDADYAGEVADFFLQELLRNGTTTAQVMCTVHPQSAEILFQKSLKKNLRLIAGKTLMNSNAPGYLLDDASLGFEASLELIQKWHGQGRLSYAVTPRFAITSTESQLEKAGELLNSHLGLYLHTHLSENRAEVELIKTLFPWSRDYLDVYERFELAGPRTTLAHAIHLSQQETDRIAFSQSAISFCPTSNLFIGSGLFNLENATTAGIAVGIGTDVGGGTSFSILKTLADGYKVLQLQGQSLSALKAFYLATLGGAKALHLDDKIGTFLPGREADFTVLNFNATPLIERRMAMSATLEERLFILMMLGDDRSVTGTHIMGVACGNPRNA